MSGCRWGSTDRKDTMPRAVRLAVSVYSDLHEATHSTSGPLKGRAARNDCVQKSL